MRTVSSPSLSSCL
uniref:Uncharacterized protein n=1 Tax=Anguilla anguilla TaxID=7936 RepID=A0A0E9PZ93_ANGAN